MTLLVIGFIVLALAFAATGVYFVSTHAATPDAGWFEIGRASLTLAVSLAVGGAASVIVKKVEEQRSERTAWNGLLRQLVEADQAVAVCRHLILAHKSAATYRDQMAELAKTQLTLRHLMNDPLVRTQKAVRARTAVALRAVVPTSDGEMGALNGLERIMARLPSRAARSRQAGKLYLALDQMFRYVKRLGDEYEKGYLAVARQQRADELWLKTLSEAAATSGKPNLDSAFYKPTSSWLMLKNCDDFPFLNKLLDKSWYTDSEFAQNFVSAKPILERKAGITRTVEYAPAQVGNS